jgi:hypothetical protein
MTNDFSHDPNEESMYNHTFFYDPILASTSMSTATTLLNSTERVDYFPRKYEFLDNIRDYAARNGLYGRYTYDLIEELHRILACSMTSLDIEQTVLDILGQLSVNPLRLD